MKRNEIILNSYKLGCYNINTLIIGSGAASLNAAVSLHSMGQEDILIATAQWGGGTSRNAGSDKQTYYKLALSGDEPDSVPAMAKDLFNGKCMHGDIALCEAQGSVQAFINLVNLGVKFPHDKYGSWAGYKTDNDQHARATSAGPYTSKRMFEALEAEVKRKKIPVLDHHQCIALLTDKKRAKVIGALAINTEEEDYKKAFVLFNSTNVILGTGGPAGMYETSVYPLSQSGSSGMALIAGATAHNLTESQFGIASVKFRWNLSGSYQQVTPRYFSTNKQGKDEREFLNDFFPDSRTLLKAIFLKGYHWPFDPQKIKNCGSSIIDLLVHKEISEKGRDVFIDFTRNPTWKLSDAFSLENLDPEQYDYLKNSNALKNTPYERLLALNSPAIALYKEHGIDLASEPLQIAVCVQHNNGGLKAGIWWESDLRHLFPVGEINGSHGVHRPGGSALNSGQVGSFRAASYICKEYSETPPASDIILSESSDRINNILSLAASWMASGKNENNLKYLSEIRQRMSESAGIIRDFHKVSGAKKEAEKLMKKLPADIGASSVGDLASSFLLYDHCISHLVYLEAIGYYLFKGGRSRGSFIVINPETKAVDKTTSTVWEPELCNYDREVETKIMEVNYRDGILSLNMVEVREIPCQNLWFEKVWKEYLEDNYQEC